MSFAQTLRDRGLVLTRTAPETLQLNLGKRCNLTCAHCHVNAGPARKELMTRETADRILSWVRRYPLPIVDLTGGAPEMMPDFRYLVCQLRELLPESRIIDRCNLTILLESGYEDLPEFLAQQRVEIVASMPCYSPENVNAQRGDGVFDGSIRGLQRLNALGYGRQRDLPLHLVYNPLGATLPGPQAELETDYKRELKAHFGIVFNQLYTITNLPIARFAAHLRRTEQYEAYLELLREAFNPATVPALMCRSTLNVSWQGEVFDCDFNQMLDWAWTAPGGSRIKLWELDLSSPSASDRPIRTGDHCYGCTAGAGSSCTGRLV